MINRLPICLILCGLVWLAEASALDFSGYDRADVDWREAAIARPPRAIKDRMAGLGASKTLVDAPGVGRPSTCRGDAVKYAEWIAKLQAYIIASYETSHTWLEWANP